MRNLWSLLLTKFHALSVVRRGLFLAIAAIFCFAFLGRFNRQLSKPPSPGVSESPRAERVQGTLQTDEDSKVDVEKLKDFPEMMSATKESRTPVAREMGGALPGASPLIAHTAELAVATKEFARSRTSFEEILERHRAYAARLRMVGRRSGSVLSATLRIPSSELGTTVIDLKSLGDVEQEEQSADEVTQQRADLEARLSNAQGTLRRLQGLLKKQTYPDGNVRELQRQIASVTTEIQRLEAERLASEHRVIFANVQFSLREVVPAPVESLGAQFHGAAVTGFSEAAASLSALLLFFIGRGPVALLCIAILYLPARLVWRRWQPTAVQGAAPVH